MTTTFTGGVFSIKDKKIIFHCLNNDAHTVHVSFRDFNNMSDNVFRDASSYNDYGVICFNCPYTSADYKSVLEPKLIKPLCHMVSLDSSEREIAFYLRSNGYYELVDDRAISIRPTNKQMMVELVSVPDGTITRLSNMVGKKVFINKNAINNNDYTLQEPNCLIDYVCPDHVPMNEDNYKNFDNILSFRSMFGTRCDGAVVKLIHIC